MSSGVQSTTQPLTWTKNEELCLSAVNHTLAYRSLLTIAIFTPTLYMARKLQINLHELSLGNKLFTIGSLTLLNTGLAYAPAEYLQHQITPKLAERQQQLAQSMKTAYETFDRNRLFTDSQLSKPNSTWSSLQTEIATIASKDQTFQKNPLQDKATWAALWEDIKKLYQLELHAPLPSTFELNSFLTRDSGDFFVHCVKDGQGLISLAGEIQEELKKIDGSLLSNNRNQLDAVLRAFSADVEENMNALDPALHTLAKKARDYLQIRMNYCGAYEQACQRNHTLPVIMSTDACFAALSQPPQEQFSNERKQFFQIYAIFVATLVGISVGGLA
jgi:hypothetical protein